MGIQSHPAYSEGFFDAMGDTPIFDDCSAEYRAGWEAAMRSRDIFRTAGFEQHGGEFTAKAILRAGHSNE